MPFRPEITNGTGAVHGGAIVSLCDTVFYVALASIYGREQETTTASLTVQFLSPALPPHDLIAEANVLKAGRRIVYGEVYVRSGDKIVAHATLNFLNTQSRGAPRRAPPRAGRRSDREEHGALRRARRARARGWFRSAASRCRCSTRAFSRSTTPCATAPGSSISRTWGSSCSKATASRTGPTTLTINAVGTMKPMQARYNIFCNPAGGAHDDVDFLPPATIAGCWWSTRATPTRCGRTSTRISSRRRALDEPARRERADRDSGAEVGRDAATARRRGSRRP